MPSTSRARVAIGSVKLPRPQNQSITRSSACASSSRSARDTSTRLMCGLTCVKSVGLNGMRDAELRQRVGQLARRPRPAGAPCPAPWAAATTARRMRRGEGAQPAPGRRRSAAPGGAAPAPSRRRRRPARSADRSRCASMRADQLAQRQQQGAHVRRHAHGIRACRPRSGSCARGSRPAPCPSCARGAPKSARASGSPRSALRSGAAPSRP